MQACGGMLPTQLQPCTSLPRMFPTAIVTPVIERNTKTPDISVTASWREDICNGLRISSDCFFHCSTISPVDVNIPPKFLSRPYAWSCVPLLRSWAICQNISEPDQKSFSNFYICGSSVSWLVHSLIISFTSEQINDLEHLEFVTQTLNMKSKELNLPVKQAIIRLKYLNTAIREIQINYWYIGTIVHRYIPEKKECTAELRNTKMFGRTRKVTVCKWKNSFLGEEKCCPAQGHPRGGRCIRINNQDKTNVCTEGLPQKVKEQLMIRKTSLHIMAWAFMADVTVDKSNRMNSEKYKAVLSVQI